MTFAEYGWDEIRFHPGWRSLVDSAAASSPAAAVFSGRNRSDTGRSSPSQDLLRRKYQHDLEWQLKPTEVFLAREVMHSPVISIHADATLEEAHRLMQTQGVGHLPVHNGEGLPVGMLSHNDIFQCVMRPGLATATSLSETVKSRMSTPLLACIPEADVREIARVFLLRRIGSLVVVHESALLGILTRTDLLRSLMEHPSLSWSA